MNYFDLHCDTPYECYVKGKEFSDLSLAVNAFGDNYFDNWKQTFAVWIRDDEKNPFDFYNAVLKDFKAKLMKAKSKVKPIFALEGASLLNDDLDLIYKLKADDIKLITLTWNGENKIAGGINSQKGLTEYGKRVIDKMNTLKIGCDLSHLNKKSFYMAVENAKYPLVTHSCCNEVINHKRNLDNEQIKTVAKNGGVIGICFYPQFIGKEPFLGAYKNIFNICDMGYEDCICIGSDFDGALMDKRLNGISKIQSLYCYLEDKGIKKELLWKFFYQNAENYIAKLV